MDLECPKQPPPYYTRVLHSIAFISFPINFLGCYLIIFKSPSNSNYKYRQLYLQIVTFLVENHMTWIGGGYYYYPLFGGFNTSPFLSHIISAHTSVVGLVFVLAFELPSLISCFQYRASSAADLNPRQKIPPLLTYVMTVIGHCFPFVVAISILLSKPSYEEQYTYVSQHFPKCLHVFDNVGFIVYDWRTNLGLIIAAACAVTWIAVFSCYAFGLAVYTMLTLHAMRSHMSAATFKLHRSALIALTFQCVVPSSFIITPLSIIGLILLLELSALQELATDSWFLLAAHSVVSTIVMIGCNGRYMGIVRDFLKGTKTVKSTNVSVTVKSINGNHHSIGSRI
ncbi:unnamed protein product [Caenorhabditis angaria]|uniref:Serpentine Receptor, class H n=1 Tax=Caenorhabditis angaria TaxID=860376 RepID=A0A9P1N1U8_9PELO|nr:unnamed protein product [Caenorhabditis angaria]